MFIIYSCARSGLRNGEKEEKQTFFQNIKNNKITASDIRNTFIRNLNGFLI